MATTTNNNEETIAIASEVEVLIIVSYEDAWVKS